MSHRIRHPGFAAKRQSAEQAAQFIRHGMTVGMSGFTGAGYPKAVPGALAQRITASHGAGEPFRIKVLTGAAAGREVSLTKVVTTLGKPGVQVASITKRPTGYVFAHVEGTHRPSVNGIPLTGESIALRTGDLIELAGTQMQFIQG